jgi:predicted nucleic acid-binding Zn ribbon protein
MAEPATRPPAGDDAPPFDPIAVDRAYLQERARRRARIERSRERRRASLRFWLVLLALLAVSVLLSLTIWREIERLFGL